MSELRVDAIPALEKPWAYVTLTKPDVTFLVVITTVAGFYLGSNGSLDWALLLHTLFGTMLVAGGTAALNQYIERDMDAIMRRTASRPLPTGTTAAARSSNVRRGYNCRRHDLACTRLQYPIGGDSSRYFDSLSRCLHAAEDPNYTRHGDWRDSRGASAADRLGGSSRIAFYRCLGFVCDYFLLAVPAFHGDCVDVSRRLRACGHAYAPRGRSKRRRHVSADRLHVGDSGVGERAAFGAWNGGNSLLFRRARSWHAFAPGGIVGESRSRTNARAKWLMHATVAHIPLLLVWMILDKLTR